MGIVIDNLVSMLKSLRCDYGLVALFENKGIKHLNASVSTVSSLCGIQQIKYACIYIFIYYLFN